MFRGVVFCRLATSFTLNSFVDTFGIVFLYVFSCSCSCLMDAGTLAANDFFECY
jgi:hypothetical protein